MQQTIREATLEWWAKLAREGYQMRHAKIMLSFVDHLRLCNEFGIPGDVGYNEVQIVTPFGDICFIL